MVTQCTSCKRPSNFHLPCFYSPHTLFCHSPTPHTQTSVGTITIWLNAHPSVPLNITYPYTSFSVFETPVCLFPSSSYKCSPCQSLCFSIIKLGKIMVNLSRYRPGQALGVPRTWGSRISRQSAYEGGKVISPTHRPSLPPGRIPGTHFC